jgi:hypothetical protein
MAQQELCPVAAAAHILEVQQAALAAQAVREVNML